MTSNGWESYLAGLEAIDWSKKNPEWENICIVANSVVSNRQARAATKAFIKAKLGIALTDGEERTLASAQSRGTTQPDRVIPDLALD
jgi:DNA sulfur modification protein DndB